MYIYSYIWWCFNKRRKRKRYLFWCTMSERYWVDSKEISGKWLLVLTRLDEKVLVFRGVIHIKMTIKAKNEYIVACYLNFSLSVFLDFSISFGWFTAQHDYNKSLHCNQSPRIYPSSICKWYVEKQNTEYDFLI